MSLKGWEWVPGSSRKWERNNTVWLTSRAKIILRNYITLGLYMCVSTCVSVPGRGQTVFCMWKDFAHVCLHLWNACALLWQRSWSLVHFFVGAPAFNRSGLCHINTARREDLLSAPRYIHQLSRQPDSQNKKGKVSEAANKTQQIYLDNLEDIQKKMRNQERERKQLFPHDHLEYSHTFFGHCNLLKCWSNLHNVLSKGL